MSNPILTTEYSRPFDELRQRMVIMSYYKYGPAKINFEIEKTCNIIGSLELRLEEYKRTGNTEFLADIANFAMFEFMFPQHPQAHYTPTDGGQKIDGFGVNEIKDWEELNT